MISYNLNLIILNGLTATINNSVNRIAKTVLKANSSLFTYQTNNNHPKPTFVVVKEKQSDFKVIGHKNFNRQFIFGIKTNPNSYLHQFVEEIEFLIYLDEKNQLLSGGVCLNYGNDHNLNDFDLMIYEIFKNDFTNHFINRHIGAISLNKLVAAFEEKTPTLSDSALYHKWLSLLEKRYPKLYPKFVAKGTSSAWFHSILIILGTILIIYEDLRKHFQHKDPSSFNNRLVKSVIQKVINQPYQAANNSEHDWSLLLTLIKSNYLKKIDTSEIKNLDDIDDYLDEVWTIEEDESFLKPIVSYEITRNSTEAFIDQEQNIFNDDQFQAFFLLAAAPKIFSLTEVGDRHITLGQFRDKLKNLAVNELLNETLDHYVESLICEWNYDYATFLNPQLSFLIIKNKNPLVKTGKKLVYSDINLNLYINYCWSVIYSQARLWKLWSIEFEFNHRRDQWPAQMRQYLYQLNNLRYDWNDDFYGMKEIKKIVKKVNEYNNVENSLEELIIRINRYDHDFGKYKERLNMRYGLIAAAFFGILDFFTTIFSILPVTYQKQTNILPVSIIFIVIGSILLFCLIISVGWIVYHFYFKKKLIQWKKEK